MTEMMKKHHVLILAISSALFATYGLFFLMGTPYSLPGLLIVNSVNAYVYYRCYVKYRDRKRQREMEKIDRSISIMNRWMAYDDMGCYRGECSHKVYMVKHIDPYGKITESKVHSKTDCQMVDEWTKDNTLN